MIVFFVCIVVLLIGLSAAAVMGRIGGFMAEPTSSQAFSGVPAGSLTSSDIGALHFDRALRGYRMDEVDEVIDALRAHLRELESEVAPAPAESEVAPAPAESEVAPAPAESEVAPAPAEGASWPAGDGSRDESGASGQP